MKKFLLPIFLFLSLLANAEEHRIYSIVVMDSDNTPPVIIKETTTSGSSWSGFDFKSNYLRDEEGNEIKFNNFLPLLGYLQSIGWTIPDIEDQIIKNEPTTVSGRSVFLVYKDVSEREWLDWIENGKKKKKK